jgi:hypothetical protein
MYYQIIILESWQILSMFMETMASELLYTYLRSTKESPPPSLLGFYQWYLGVSNPNYKFMAEVVFTYCLAFHVFRAGVRRNNSCARTITRTSNQFRKEEIPARRHLPIPNPAISKNCFLTPPLTVFGRRSSSNYRSCWLRRITRSSQEIEGKSAAEELQIHRRPIVTEALGQDLSGQVHNKTKIVQSMQSVEIGLVIRNGCS